MDSPQGEEPVAAPAVEQRAQHVIIVGAGKLHFLYPDHFIAAATSLLSSPCYNV